MANPDFSFRVGLTRRTVLRTAAGTALGAAGASVLAGCQLVDNEPEPAPTPDPAQPVLNGALSLAAAYERLIATKPALAERLTPIAEAHKAHAAELIRTIGGATPAAPSTAPPGAASPGDVAALRTAEQRAQRIATTLCRSAPGTRAALLGSIAAARAAHVEALRDAA